MLIVNTEHIEGKKLETLGLVSGSTVQAKHIGKDFMAGFKNIIGGEMTSYTEMMEECRAVATDRMIRSAAALGADAVVNVRYLSSEIAQGAAEVMAYGTAVKFIG